VANGQTHRVLVEAVVVCSRVVSDASRRRFPRPAIAATPVARRRGVGVAGRRAGVIGPARTAKNGGASSTGVIGNDGGSDKPRPLTRHRARASAQRMPAKILRSGCAIGPAVTSYSRCQPMGRAGVFAAWLAAGSYGEGSIGRHAIASGDDAGGVNVCTPGVALPTPPEACLSVWEPRYGQLKVPPTPKRRKERVGTNVFRVPRFLSSRGEA
jgi:hypothetical protein